MIIWKLGNLQYDLTVKGIHQADISLFLMVEKMVFFLIWKKFNMFPLQNRALLATMGTNWASFTVPLSPRML